ncbi:MAG: amidohydrolase [Gemmatimonadota bacterium]|nr:amidohydrolase [Gemmatimonadota bacterium]MDH3569619.1 amidohydrolase [Gemmatimonadota bacterium]MDH5550420.1 amidohydrolase [Gemmatimonadota bacterium]
MRRTSVTRLRHRPLSLGIVFGLATLVAACTAEPEIAADLVLRNGKVVSVDPATPDGEAIAVLGDTILAVGSDREMSRYIGRETEVIDLAGRLAIPGFIEGHGHFLGIGSAKMQLDLMHVANWDEIVAMVADAASDAPAGALIQGRGWHQEKWDRAPPGNVDGLPTHRTLSAVSPNNPVILRHASGHAAFANAKAMQMAGITRSTPDPPGGEIVRDADGNPIGAFRETAQGLLGPAAANAAPPDTRRQAEMAIEEVLSKGITSFQDAGVGFATLDLYRAMVDDGSMGVRMWAMIRAPNQRLADGLAAARTVDYGDHRLTVRAIKVSVDGALGPHGAWLLEPYTDLPTSRGLNTSPIDALNETARLALQHDYQLCVHAIGDRANREVLNVYERAFGTAPDKRDLRWRIEHAQHLHPNDIPRFGQLGVIAAMQGIHATSDGPWVIPRLGEQRSREGAYVWRSLWDSGAIVTNGTDAPVEDVDPIASYYATVSRKLKDGSVFFPEQRLSRMEALQSYTSSNALAAFEESIKGSLTPGKLADITVLSKDILTIPEDEIPTTTVDYTIVGGIVMYAREGN